MNLISVLQLDLRASPLVKVFILFCLVVDWAPLNFQRLIISGNGVRIRLFVDMRNTSKQFSLSSFSVASKDSAIHPSTLRPTSDKNSSPIYYRYCEDNNFRIPNVSAHLLLMVVFQRCLAGLALLLLSLFNVMPVVDLLLQLYFRLMRLLFACSNILLVSFLHVAAFVRLKLTQQALFSYQLFSQSVCLLHIDADVARASSW